MFFGHRCENIGASGEIRQHGTKGTATCCLQLRARPEYRLRERMAFQAVLARNLHSVHPSKTKQFKTWRTADAPEIIIGIANTAKSIDFTALPLAVHDCPLRKLGSGTVGNNGTPKYCGCKSTSGSAFPTAFAADQLLRCTRDLQLPFHRRPHEFYSSLKWCGPVRRSVFAVMQSAGIDEQNTTATRKTTPCESVFSLRIGRL